VATKIMPRMPVELIQGTYYKFDKSFFDIKNDVRQPGDRANEVQRGWILEPYFCVCHSLAEVLPDEIAANADTVIGLEADIVERLKQLVWNRYEVTVLGDGGIVTDPGNNIYNNTLNLTNLQTADPRNAVNLAINAIEEAAGVSPNMIVMNPKIARRIMATDQYREEAKYVVDIRNEGGAGDLPSQFYGLEAAYAQSLVNTANRGEPANLQRVLTDKIWIGHVSKSGSFFKTLTYGFTFEYREASRSWYDESRQSTYYQYDWMYDGKVVAKECGALLNVTM
jgi:hypothetical protein